MTAISERSNADRAFETSSGASRCCAPDHIPYRRPRGEQPSLQTDPTLRVTSAVGRRGATAKPWNRPQHHGVDGAVGISPLHERGAALAVTARDAVANAHAVVGPNARITESSASISITHAKFNDAEAGNVDELGTAGCANGSVEMLIAHSSTIPMGNDGIDVRCDRCVALRASWARRSAPTPVRLRGNGIGVTVFRCSR